MRRIAHSLLCVFFLQPELVFFCRDYRDFDLQSSGLKVCKEWARAKGKIKLCENLVQDLKKTSFDPNIECQRLLQIQKLEVFKNERGCKEKYLCVLCGEAGTSFKCERCARSFHDICLSPPIFLDEEGEETPAFQCPCCGFRNRSNSDEHFVRLGLTPDWLIHEVAFNVFQLQQPTAERP